MKIAFAGTPEFAAGFLTTLLADDVAGEYDLVAVVTQPDKPGKRGKRLHPSPVKQVAEAAGLAVLQPDKLRLEHLAALDLDLMVVVAYGQILKPEVLSYPKRGCINVHASLLPRWRGAAPVQRAILAGDTESGITLIQMDAGLDTGDMLARTAVAVSDSDTAGDLFDKFSAVGRPLLLETLGRLDTVTPEKQDDSLAVYAHKLEKQEARIDWSADATIVDRTVRAFNPDPIAYTSLGDMRTRIHTGKAVAGETGEPGEILAVSKAGILVACADHAYLVERIQLPVGKGAVLSGADVLNGWSDTLHAGACFEIAGE